MFNETWFTKHQRLLVNFSNTYIGRYILHINGKRSSVGKNKIIKIVPNAIFWKGNKKNEVVAEFRTHNKFSKRIFYAFYPIWWLAHQWDTLFANNFQPNWNLGFDVLTQYPNSIGVNNPVDGTATRTLGVGSGVVWATLIAGAGNQSRSNASDNLVSIVADTGTNNWRQNRRGIALFDTSSLRVGATISAATLSFFGLSKSDTGTAITPNINVYASTPASNTALADADYGQTGSTAFATAITYAGWSTVAYNDFALNANGLANISVTSISKFSAKNANYDVAASAPTWSSASVHEIDSYLANQTGTANDPKLVVTFIPLPLNNNAYFM
jgi:hypothetical protein